MPASDEAFRTGVAEFNAGRIARARSALRRAAIADGPEAPWAGQQLVQTRIQRGLSHEVESRLRRWLSPNGALLDWAIGYLYRRFRRAPEAAALLEKALAKDVWAAATELAIARSQAGDYGSASRLLTRAGEAFRRNGDSWGLATVEAGRAAVALGRAI